MKSLLIHLSRLFQSFYEVISSIFKGLLSLQFVLLLLLSISSNVFFKTSCRSIVDCEIPKLFVSLLKRYLQSKMALPISKGCADMSIVWCQCSSIDFAGHIKWCFPESWSWLPHKTYPMSWKKTKIHVLFWHQTFITNHTLTNFGLNYTLWKIFESMKFQVDPLVCVFFFKCHWRPSVRGWPQISIFVISLQITT